MADTAEARKLEEKGYRFSGHYSWGKEEAQKRAEELRKEGNKARVVWTPTRVVWTPSSKYSRSSSGGGWSVYWIESEFNKKVRERRSQEARLYDLKKEREELQRKLGFVEAGITELENALVSELVEAVEGAGMNSAAVVAAASKFVQEVN